MTVTPIDLFTQALYLREDRSVTSGERRMTGGADGWHLAAFHLESLADAHPDHWEVHPAAEEVVAVLRGSARLFLRPPEEGGAEEAATLAEGTAVIVPRGRWHRLEVDGPTDLMTVTLREGTRLEPR
ncbi:cupin domain-containing protein [Actinomadura kijaniata]|uniref:cupin domain-containing protein n=1 Tax=Actinomadura kijaniata TaxID=46161 RepID=UPI003F1BCA9A